MAKYITLEGLGHFLNTIKSDKFLAIDTCYGCIKTGYEENNNNYAIKVDTSAWAAVEWTNNKVTSVGNHYQQSTKPTQTKYGIYNITIDAAGHITKSSIPQKNNFAGVWTELNEPIYKELTYATLKEARDSGKLATGRLYRITDYSATSLKSNNNYYEMRNPGKFDIIVEAISNSTISETAWVCHHEGDTYFSECELDKWEIKYCIDNDDERFVWPKTNGYGVIYYMKDEWGNEAPYDFKNLSPSPSFAYDSSMYLFNNSKNRDASVKGYKFDQTGETELPRKNNIFPTNNIIKPNCNRNVPGIMDTAKTRFEVREVDENFTGVSNNYIDYNCTDIIFSSRSHNDYVSLYNGSYGCHNNIIGRDCYNITMRNSDNNEIADGCYNIQLSNCDNTKIGRNCFNIVFVDDLQYYDSAAVYNSTNFPLPLQKSKNNIIGNNLHNITIGISCNNNIFENGGDESIGPNTSVLGHCCNDNLIKTNSNMNLTYHEEISSSFNNFYPLPGVENCIFNKCIGSTITFLELAIRGSQYDKNTINPEGIGSFYFDDRTPLHNQYKFKNFEFVNISAKEYSNYLERLVYDPANDNISELSNYINKLKGIFNREYRTLATLKVDYSDPDRKLNSVSKYG